MNFFGESGLALNKFNFKNIYNYLVNIGTNSLYITVIIHLFLTVIAPSTITNFNACLIIKYYINKYKNVRLQKINNFPEYSLKRIERYFKIL